MTRESSKTRAFRPADFADRYLKGRVIDIGCGPDLIVPHAEPFDREHGNAEDIGSLRVRGSYDAVCSSHCLEHMSDVRKALAEWWSLVKGGGYLIIVVPEEDLYEQGAWPSLFNSDHKATFRMARPTRWSPVSYDIRDEIERLAGARIISCELQDQFYDHSLRASSISAFSRWVFKIHLYVQAGIRKVFAKNGDLIGRPFTRMCTFLGMPVDQTAGDALAQIQIVAQKMT